MAEKKQQPFEYDDETMKSYTISEQALHDGTVMPVGVGGDGMIVFKKQEKEAVDHPSHYGGDTPHEVIKCLEAWGLEFDALRWNAVKYIARAGKKGDMLTDLRKAAFYLNRRIAALEEELHP